MAWQFKFGNAPRFNGRENTSSGKTQEPMKLESGAAQVGGILGSGEPGKATGFRPGGYRQTGYNTVGGSSGIQVKIPNVTDQSNVHSTASLIQVM